MCSNLETVIIAAIVLWIVVVIIFGGIGIHYYITSGERNE